MIRARIKAKIKREIKSILGFLLPKKVIVAKQPHQVIFYILPYSGIMLTLRKIDGLKHDDFYCILASVFWDSHQSYILEPKEVVKLTLKDCIMLNQEGVKDLFNRLNEESTMVIINHLLEETTLEPSTMNKLREFKWHLE